MGAVCACGRPLHYDDDELAMQAFVEWRVAHYGATVPVATPTGTWLVPRHYIALHGMPEVSVSAAACGVTPVTGVFDEAHGKGVR